MMPPKRSRSDPVVAVVIPCYRERQHVLDVLACIPSVVTLVYCVDDGCPEGTGDRVEAECPDPRVVVLRHDRNRGVGGAMVTGYRRALEDGADIIVKLDGDGQMDPRLIPRFIRPIVSGAADYTKGNRFYRPEELGLMPYYRVVGNAVLSFMNKLSTGYWHLFDANNGYTVIHAGVLKLIPLDKIETGYFFESDMLFRLNTIRAVVIDIPMKAHYGREVSSISLWRVIGAFTVNHTRNFFKRIAYSYFLRDFQVASVEWVLGPILLGFGVVFGVHEWVEGVAMNVAATAGTVMLAALPTIVGLQFILSALSFDIDNRPSIPLQGLLEDDDDHDEH